MAKGMLGRKVGMARVFDEKGRQVPVTVVSCGPCYVSAIRTTERDGYNAVQIAYGETLEKRLSKAEVGHLKKGNLGPMSHLKEYRNMSADGLSVGAELSVSIFETGDVVNVIGQSKGKGFQGVMRRYGFGGGRSTHGSKFHRAPGSLGPGTDPGRVFKGKKMPGQTGAVRITVRNLQVVGVDEANQLLFVSGAIPGPVKGLVSIEGLK